MPYIRKAQRDAFEPELQALRRKVEFELQESIRVVKTNALFNYITFSLLLLLPQSYAEMSQAMAGVNDAVEEYRRRFLNPLEDMRREENGDII